MILQTIIQVAAQCGWSVTANVRDGNITSFDFRRNTESGVPFCFSADMTGGKPASLVDDILSFIDAFQPDIFARSGAGFRVPERADMPKHSPTWTAYAPRHGYSPSTSPKPSPLRAPRRGISGTDSAVYRFFRFLPRLTCGWSSRKIMSLPSISLCQPFSERRYGSTGGDCLMYS